MLLWLMNGIAGILVIGSFIELKITTFTFLIL